MNARQRMLETFAGRPVDHLACQPIPMTFAARQAGVLYGDYCRDWRVLTQAQLFCAERFGWDLLSVCSDPAREAADCGAPIEWFPDQPPTHHPERVLLDEKTKLADLTAPDPVGGGRMHDRVLAAEALQEASGGLPVLGWIEGPFAEAANLRGLHTIMVDLVDDPEWVGELLDFAVEMETAFARAQAPYVDCMGIGDAACSLLSPGLYEQHVAPRQKRLIAAVQEMGLPVRLHICGRTTHLFRGMSTLGAEMVDVDAMGDLELARETLGPGVTLLGNADPVRTFLHSTPEETWNVFEDCLERAGYPFIVGPGCEIPAAAPPENVDAMVRFARQHTA